MSSESAQTPGNLLEELIKLWKEKHPRRALGGWWALAGFSFQMSAFLIRFFQGLGEGVHEPGYLAEMERLSDILAPQDGLFVLTQAKRTLRKANLVEALKEAYLVTAICLEKMPHFLERLRFQIVCRKRETPLSITDISLGDVLAGDVDESCWEKMRERFNPHQPIIEEPDTLDRLSVYLWSLGIRNPGELIEKCHGLTLRFFGHKDSEAIRELGWSLQRAFVEAPRLSLRQWDQPIKLLTLEDVTPEPDAASCTRVLIADQPRFEHLRHGYCKDRQPLFDHLWGRFTHCLDHWEHQKEEGIIREKVPIFWVGGRSGAGKSVLLLQLLARFIQQSPEESVLHLGSGMQLPQLLDQVPEGLPGGTASSGSVYAMVDDLYNLRDREDWEARLRAVLAVKLPPVAVITCGPSEQRDQLAAQMGDLVEIASFEVPPKPELQDFLHWYEERTGQARDLATLTRKNPILVQLMFELAKGETLQPFARRFGERLGRLHLFEAARTIVAVTALYMDAPLSLLTSDTERDALEFLCEEEQLHFRLIPPETTPGFVGVRLAHPHLAWQIFLHWVRPPATREKALARELARALAAMEDEGTTSQYALLHQLLESRHLSAERIESGPAATATRPEVIKELYRLHLERHQGRPAPASLLRWLELVAEIPGLDLDPSPAGAALQALGNETVATTSKAAMAPWLWQVAETEPEPGAEGIREAVKTFLMQSPHNPGVVFALVRILSRAGWGDSPTRQFALHWLEENRHHFQAYNVLAPLVANNPEDPEVKDRAIQWLADNPRHPHAYHVLAPLVAKNPAAPEVKARAIQWLADNSRHPHAYQLLAPLVANIPQDQEVKEKATQWLAANPNHPQIYHVLAPLVVNNPEDPEVKDRTIQWLADNVGHPHRNQVLGPLISRCRGDKGWLDQGMAYLREPGTRYHQNIVAALLMGSGAAHPYVELTLDYLQGGARPKDKNFVLFKLAQALAYNPKNAFACLQGAFPEASKITVSGSIAVALRRFPEMAPDFLEAWPGTLPTRYQALILVNLLAEKVNLPETDRFLADWLDKHYRQPGYDTVLRALQQAPETRARLADSGMLAADVLQDLKKLQP